MTSHLLLLRRWPTVRSWTSAGPALPCHCLAARPAAEPGSPQQPDVITDGLNDGLKALQARAQATSDGAT
ncbi:MAG TPA: hypothetical protein VL334_01535, partial [Anaerolineae bacterium]|nr:hypothetical protein [Anaerolineae bacterium]